MNLYLAGSMRGNKLHNFPEFFRTAIALRNEGHVIHNPAEIDMAKGFNPAESIDSESNSKVFDINSALREDFLIILEKGTEGIALMQGWRSSVGARAEALVAYYAGRTVYEVRWAHGQVYLDRVTDAPTVAFEPAEDYTG